MEMLIQLQNKADITILLPLFERLGVSIVAQTGHQPVPELANLLSTDSSALLAVWAQWQQLQAENPIKPKNDFINHSLPITYAKKPNFKALAGIWKNHSINAADLRKAAWGNRL